MIELTERAALQVKKYLDKRGSGQGIRIGVKTTGCSGLSYVLEYFDTVHEQEIVSLSNGVQIKYDPKHAVYLSGTLIDWVKEGLNQGFKFINPNERDRCGCGESFTV